MNYDYTPPETNRQWLHKSYFRGRLLVVSGRVKKWELLQMASIQNPES